MRQPKAFTLYYLLPFGIYSVFAALQSPSTLQFWGLLVMGGFFALVGLFLLQSTLDKTTAPAPLSTTPPEPLTPIEEPPPLPTPVIINHAREEELEALIKAKDEELLSLRQQQSALQADFAKNEEQLKAREASIQELRFEVRSLLAISRGKNAPATS